MGKHLIPNAQVISSGLCHRPVTSGGKPIIAKIKDEVLGLKANKNDVTREGNNGGGVFVAAGHGPWGISMSLGTGKVMAEMILGMKTSADVSRLGIY